MMKSRTSGILTEADMVEVARRAALAGEPGGARRTGAPGGLSELLGLERSEPGSPAMTGRPTAVSRMADFGGTERPGTLGGEAGRSAWSRRVDPAEAGGKQPHFEATRGLASINPVEAGSASRSGRSGFGSSSLAPTGSSAPIGGAASTPGPSGYMASRELSPEEWVKKLKEEADRLTRASRHHDVTIRKIQKSYDYRRETTIPGLYRDNPGASPRQKIQNILALIRGTDADYAKNGDRPLPGTLNARYEEVQRTLRALSGSKRTEWQPTGSTPKVDAQPAPPAAPKMRQIDALNLYPIKPPTMLQSVAVKAGRFIPGSGVQQHEDLSQAIRDSISAGAIPAPAELAPSDTELGRSQERRLAKLREVVESYNTELKREHSFEVSQYSAGGPEEAAIVLNTTPWVELNTKYGKRWNWRDFGQFAKERGLGRLSEFDKKVLNSALNARRIEWLDKAVGRLQGQREQVVEGALFVAAELFGAGAAPLVLRGLGIVGRGLASSRGGQVLQRTLRKAAESRVGQGVTALSHVPVPKPVARGEKAVLKALTPSEAKFQNAFANLVQEAGSGVLEPDPEMDAIIGRALAGAAVGYGGTGGFELLGQLARGTLRLSAEGVNVVRTRLRAGKARSDYERGKIIEASLREAKREGKLMSRSAQSEPIQAGAFAVDLRHASGARVRAKTEDLAWAASPKPVNAASIPNQASKHSEPPRRKRSLSQILLGEKPERLESTDGELQELYDHVRRVARSQKFQSRAKKLGFTGEQLKQLDHRIEGMIKEDRVGWTKVGGWLDDNQLLIGRAYKSQRAIDPRIRHELMHLLDDVADPGLIQRSLKPDFPWRGYFDAERKAWEAQLGRGASTPFNLWVAGLTASANRGKLGGAGAWIAGTAAPFLGASTYLTPRLFKDKQEDEVKSPDGR